MPIAPVIIAAGIGAAGTAYASSQANKGINKGLAAQERSDEANRLLQQQALQQSQQNNAPFMQAGYGALNQLATQFGLGQVSGGGGATSGAPQGGGINDGNPYDEYEAANPDLAREAQRVVGNDPRFATKADYYAWHDSNYGNEGRGSFTDAAPQPQTTPQAGQPQATGSGQNYGPQIAERPTFGERPTFNAPAMPSLDTANYRESPGYQNRLREAGRNTNASFAAKGILGSGAAATEFGKRMQNIADEDYDSWVNQTLGVYDRQLNQFNQDRNFADQNYESDRSFGTGVYDADRNYLTNRFDTNVNDLFRLTGLGQSAANNQSSAQNTYAANVGNQNQNYANNLSSAYGQQASNNASAFNNIAGLGQNLLTNWQTNQSSSSPSNSLTNWSQNWGGGS